MRRDRFRGQAIFAALMAVFLVCFVFLSNAPSARADVGPMVQEVAPMGGSIVADASLIAVPSVAAPLDVSSPGKTADVTCLKHELLDARCYARLMVQQPTARVFGSMVLLYPQPPPAQFCDSASRAVFVRAAG